MRPTIPQKTTTLRCSSSIARRQLVHRLLTLSLVAISLLTSTVGCQSTTEDGTQQNKKSIAGAELTLLVIGDPAVAKACIELATEWNARTEASYRVVEAGLDAALERASWGAADAVIYPSYLLGPLATAGHLEPLSEEWLDDEDVAASDVFPLLRMREATWAEETYALPCGSPSPVCYYRVDILRKFGRKPPTTWEEFSELAGLLKDRTALGDLAPADDVAWSAILEPMADDWAALTLLSRAATYAKHPNHYSALFKIGTMEPLIGGPPFVRALKEMVKLYGSDSEQNEQLTPNEVRQRFWNGQCALAIGWPSSAATDLSSDPSYKTEVKQDQPVEADFCALPAAREVFNPGQQEWEDRGDDDSGAVPLVAIEGRLASICADSDHKQAALALIAALSGREWGTTIFANSPATTLYRNSQRRDVVDWIEPPVSAAAANSYAELVVDMFTGSEAITALRIPGRERYLTALSEAVTDALAGKESPQVLLKRVAATWEKITIELGSDRQQLAYQRSLGLLP